MRQADADEEAFTLKQLAYEELLSEEQHLELAEALSKRRFVFFTSGGHQKVGQRPKFLPHTLNDLLKEEFVRFW